MSEQVSAPAGWYVNHQGYNQWWDGRQWGPLAPVAAPQVQYAVQHPGSKSVGAAYCLLIFLGGLGIHRFYLGHGGRGAALLIMWLVSVFALFSGSEGGGYLLLLLGLVVGVMLLIDLFSLAGDVRSYNHRLVYSQSVWQGSRF